MSKQLAAASLQNGNMPLDQQGLDATSEGLETALSDVDAGPLDAKLQPPNSNENALAKASTDAYSPTSVAQNSFSAQMIDGAGLALEASDVGFGSTSSFVTQEIQSTSTVAATTTLPTNFASQFSAQIADVAKQLPDQPVEITLSPEELGKVKLTFQVAENGAVNVVIAAERAETLELMRRNSDSLLEEFRSLGYENSSFEFQQEQQGDGQQAGSGFGGGDASQSYGDAAEGGNSPLSEQPLAPVQMALGSNAGMDLRL
jgi:flagellar hook-length control protein FliK